jgi:YebC/PmpR family DNA-binding regulatory protein
MSGHSKWHNIRLRKGKQDAVRGKLFTRIGKEISVAVKAGGGNPDTNVRLRMAIQTGRQNSMPQDTIKRAIQKGSGGADGANYDELTYEGYGPGGVAIIVECLTENKQRTYPNLNSAFNKNGGGIGKTGSVGYLFAPKGLFLFASGTVLAKLEEVAIEAGAEDIQTTEDGTLEVTTALEDFAAVRDAFDEAKLAYTTAEATMIPTTYTTLTGEDLQKCLKLLDAIDNDDDVQKVYHNLDFNEDELE